MATLEPKKDTRHKRMNSSYVSAKLPPFDESRTIQHDSPEQRMIRNASNEPVIKDFLSKQPSAK